MNQQPENQPDHERAENLRVLLEHHWVHGRHVESERTSFLFAYIGSIATILGLIYFARVNDWITFTPLVTWVFFSVPALITLIGLTLNIRWGDAFEKHRKNVNDIVASLELEKSINKSNLNMTIPPSRLLRPRTIFSTRYSFDYFYVLMLVILVFLAIKF